MQRTTNGLAELIRDARASCKAARNMAALLAKDEREIDGLRRELVNEAQAEAERAPSTPRARLLAQTVSAMRAMAAGAGSSASSALMESVLDGEALAAQADMVLADGEPRFVLIAVREMTSFASELAHAREAAVKELLENDRLIPSLRSTLADLRQS